MVQKTPLRSGDLNQRITVQVNTAADADRGTTGAQLEDWETAFTCWACYEADPSRPGGAEYFADDKRRVEDKALFRVRYYAATAAIAPSTHQILFGGKTFNIQRVYDPDGKQVEITIETNSIA